MARSASALWPEFGRLLLVRCKEIVHGREKIGIIPTMGLFILFAVVALVFSTNYCRFFFWRDGRGKLVGLFPRIDDD